MKAAALLLSLGALLATVDALAQQPARPSVIGRWRGAYACSHGSASLDLQISEGREGKVHARLDFGPSPQSPDHAAGAFAMEGLFDSGSRRLVLRGVQWISAPVGHTMVDLDGRLSPAGDTLSGVVPFPGCSRFQAGRVQ